MSKSIIDRRLLSWYSLLYLILESSSQFKMDQLYIWAKIVKVNLRWSTIFAENKIGMASYLVWNIECPNKHTLFNRYNVILNMGLKNPLEVVNFLTWYMKLGQLPRQLLIKTCVKKWCLRESGSNQNTRHIKNNDDWGVLIFN